jgi:hypothetical protein
MLSHSFYSLFVSLCGINLISSVTYGLQSRLNAVGVGDCACFANIEDYAASKLGIWASRTYEYNLMRDLWLTLCSVSKHNHHISCQFNC